MKKILIIEKRKRSKKLRNDGWSIRKIAKELCASKNSISKWIKIKDEEIGKINILGKDIKINKQYINLFTFCTIT